MRIAALLMLAGMLAGLTVADTRTFSRAYAAEECTGENCPPPQGQSGRDCESKKKEQTVS